MRGIATEHLPARRARPRRAWLALGVFVLSLPAVTPRIYASDEIQYFAFLRSLWFDHDLSFDNEYRHFYERGVVRSPLFHETFLERTTETGRRITFATIGCAILWAPFYLVADLGTRAAHALGASLEPDGYSWPYVAAVSYGSAVYGFLAVLLSAWAADRAWGPPRTWRPASAGPSDRTGRPASPRQGSGRAAGPSSVAAAAVWVGTPLLFYMYVAPPMSHACSAFAVAAFIACWLRVRTRWSAGGAAALGALAALMGMVREQDALIAAPVALDYLWSVRHQRMAGVMARAALGVAAFAACYAPQAVAYVILNGRLGPSGLVTRKMSWTAPHALQVLASPEHGFLFWTPLAALAIAGLAFAMIWKGGSSDARSIAGVGLLMIATQVYAAGSVESWTVAGAFGQRRFVGLTILLTMGLAALLSGFRRRAALGVALAFSVWWNVGLIVQFGTGMMDRQRLELRRNAINNFLVLPTRLPALAYRYLFHRETFYERSGPVAGR